MKKISVVIPTYGRAQMVCDCVKSVLDTGYPNLENGGSPFFLT